MSHHKLENGFSLVELMIALTLGLLLTAAVGALFFENKRNYEQNSLIAEMQDNSRYALQALSRDLSMAGFRGGLLDTDQLFVGSATLPDLSAAAAGCGPGADGAGSWPFDAAAIEHISGGEMSNDAAPVMQNGSYIQSRYGCLVADRIVPDTDVLSIRRVVGVDTAQASLLANTFYLRTNKTVGSLFFSGSPASAPGSGHPPDSDPQEYWEYDSRLYYIRDYSRTVGDGIPTLCRAFLADSATPTVDTECLADGVQDMEIAFGIDTNNDGVANQYFTNPTANQLRQAVTARVQLLMRSVVQDFSYTNNKTYRMMDGQNVGYAVDPDDEDAVPDRYYRRIQQTTVALRNPSLLSGVTP